MPEIQTPVKPENIAAAAQQYSEVTGNVASVNEIPAPEKVRNIIMEGQFRDVTVSDRQPMASEEDVYLKYGVHLGRLVAAYELPFDAETDPSGKMISPHTIYIFDDSNPRAQHADPDKKFTIISHGALERLGESNLHRRKDAFEDPDIIQIGEGQQLDVGRRGSGNWTPKEVAAAQKSEKRRTMSDLQAQFYVENGQLKLHSKGYSAGRFYGVPNAEERQKTAAIEAYMAEMRRQVGANSHTRVLNVTPGSMTQPAHRPNKGYADRPRNREDAPKRHGLRIGSLLRNRRAARKAEDHARPRARA